MHVSLATQVASSAGALLILIAYVSHHFGWMNADRAIYNVMNAAGSAILGWIALRPFQLGFTVLEWAWAVVSVYALWRALRVRPAGDTRA